MQRTYSEINRFSNVNGIQYEGKQRVTNSKEHEECVQKNHEPRRNKGTHHQLLDNVEMGRGKREKRSSWKLTESGVYIA